MAWYPSDDCFGKDGKVYRDATAKEAAEAGEPMRQCVCCGVYDYPSFVQPHFATEEMVCEKCTEHMVYQY